MVQLRAVVVVLLVVAAAACGRPPTRAAADSLDEACARGGGTVSTAACCASASDFPNTCLIGACGCSPEHSLTRKICACPEGACFDGTRCVAR